MVHYLRSLVITLNVFLLLCGVTAGNDVGNKINPQLPYDVDCSDGEPYVCDNTDSTPLCAVKTGLVFGQCGLKIAICRFHDEYDPEGKCLEQR